MVDNVVVGAGRLYVSKLDADDNPLAERYLGDSVGASLTGGEGDRLTVFAGDGADSSRKLVDKLLNVSRSMSVTLHDISLDNIELFVMGEKKDFTPAAVVDEQFPSGEPGDEFQLGAYNGATGAIGGGYTVPKPVSSSSEITGKTGNSGSTAIAATKIRWQAEEADDSSDRVDGAGGTNPASPDLVVYGDTGRVKVTKATAIDADGFRLSYTPDTSKREYVESATDPLEGAVRYVEYDPREGVGKNIYLTKATIRPNGEWPLKARDTEQQLGLTCESLGKVYVSDGVTA